MPEAAAHYRAQNIVAVIFPVDSERETGFRRYRNEEVAEMAAANADVPILFALIDPHKGRLGAREARRLVGEHGVQGFKFHPTMQGFFPGSRIRSTRRSPRSASRRCSTPARPGSARACRGEKGMRLKYSNPLFGDDVAVDFPDMPIILTHPSFPWQDEALSVATHKPNVWIDLSRRSPKYFPPILVRYADTVLRHKMLFGSDWPMIVPERWLANFAKIDIRDEVRPLILEENAMRLMGRMA